MITSGKGLSIPLTEVIIKEKGTYVFGDPQKWHLYPINVHQDYMTYLASEVENPEVELVECEPNIF